jgi:hypothetical protein
MDLGLLIVSGHAVNLYEEEVGGAQSFGVLGIARDQ